MKKLFQSLLIVGIAATFSSAAPTFTKESGIRISSSSPQSVLLSTSGFYRMYFIRDYGVFSASSTDGLSWSEEAGQRLSNYTLPLLDYSSITACSVNSLDDSRFRMIFSAQPSTDTYKLYSATSSDGLTWFNESTLDVGAASTTFVNSPRILERSNGDWRLYFTAATPYIYTSLSTDEGLTWSAATLALSAEAWEVGVATLTNGNIRLFYTAPLSGSTTNSQILSARGSDGVNFSVEASARLSTAASTGELSFPVLMRSTESFSWRMFYGFRVDGSTQPFILSGLADTPDPQRISPSQVDFTQISPSFTITGEIFDSTPTVRLTKSGESDIPGTSLTRNSDQSITVTFNTQNQTQGDWSVVVANSSGLEGTLVNGLNITFPPGSVDLANNVFRPRLGTPVTISIETFNDGRVMASLYTVDGKLINSLMDEDRTAGTVNISWDGRTGTGNLVASGTYLLRVEGPKIDVLKKIVVIK